MKKLTLLAVAIAAATFGSAASAVVLNQSVSYSDAYSGTTDWVEQTLSLQKFNPSMGVLQSVTLNYDTQFDSVFKYENLSRNGRTSNQSSNGELDFSSALGLQILTTLAEVHRNVGGKDGVVDFGGNGGYTQAVAATGNASVSWTLGVDNLSAFIGTDTLDFIVSAFSRSATVGGNRQQSIDTTAWAQVSIDYSFREALVPPPVVPTAVQTGTVPEPTSIALLGLALAAAGAASRRRPAAA